MKNSKLSESDVQKQFFNAVEWLKKQDKRWSMIVAFPNTYPFNGDNRYFAWMEHLKAMGNPKGFPDIVVFVPNKKYHGLLIELKLPTNQASEEQIKWLESLRFHGYLSLIIKTNDYRNLVTVIQQYFNNEIVLLNDLKPKTVN
jgi:hypothetical protein